MTWTENKHRVNETDENQQSGGPIFPRPYVPVGDKGIKKELRVKTCDVARCRLISMFTAVLFINSITYLLYVLILR